MQPRIQMMYWVTSARFWLALSFLSTVPPSPSLQCCFRWDLPACVHIACLAGFKLIFVETLVPVHTQINRLYFTQMALINFCPNNKSISVPCNKILGYGWKRCCSWSHTVNANTIYYFNTCDWLYPYYKSSSNLSNSVLENSHLGTSSQISV